MSLPAYYVVGARPVKTVPTPDGGMDVLAYDWNTGEFRRDMSYLTRITLPDAEVDALTEAEFERRVAELRAKRGQ
jgi:hypothetical protein